jgi:hypothetical protein
MILWALIIISFGKPMIIIDAFETKEECVVASKEHRRSSCHKFQLMDENITLEDLKSL